MYKVLDNFLPSSTLSNLLKKVEKSEKNKCSWFEYPAALEYQQAILEEAAGYVSLSNCVGFEEWVHYPPFTQLPLYHYDKDEYLYEKRKALKFPLCSCILYLNIQDLKGAELYISDAGTVITPETNKLVLMQPGVLHTVFRYQTGTRVSININPWDYPLKLS